MSFIKYCQSKRICIVKPSNRVNEAKFENFLGLGKHLNRANKANTIELTLSGGLVLASFTEIHVVPYSV